jgi:DNA-binding MarR family transcriptional regulator
LWRLVRHAHIFASTMREVLELQLLRESTPLPLTLAQFHALRLMALNGQHQVGQVADFLGVSAPAATKNIDKLERFGLMRRHASTGDRRATLLIASAKGRALVRRYEGSLSRRLGMALAGFAPDEVDELSRLLERFFLSVLESGADDRRSGFCLRCAAYLETGCPVGKLQDGCPYQGYFDNEESGSLPAQKES